MEDAINYLWFIITYTIQITGLWFGLYIFYYRVVDYLHAVWFYSRQGKDVAIITPRFMPIFGNLFNILQSYKQSAVEGDNYHVLKHMIDETVPVGSRASSVSFISNSAFIAVTDPNVVQELFTTKNKYFDKAPLVKDVTYCLGGEAILFTETTKQWKEARKAMSPAFYKGKLENMTEIAKEAVRTTVKRHESLLNASK